MGMMAHSIMHGMTRRQHMNTEHLKSNLEKAEALLDQAHTIISDIKDVMEEEHGEMDEDEQQAEAGELLSDHIGTLEGIADEIESAMSSVGGFVVDLGKPK
jgi:hypothetical protein